MTRQSKYETCLAWLGDMSWDTIDWLCKARYMVIGSCPLTSIHKWCTYLPFIGSQHRKKLERQTTQRKAGIRPMCEQLQNSKVFLFLHFSFCHLLCLNLSPIGKFNEWIKSLIAASLIYCHNLSFCRATGGIFTFILWSNTSGNRYNCKCHSPYFNCRYSMLFDPQKKIMFHTWFLLPLQVSLQ